MLKSYWIVAVAFGLTVLTTEVWGQSATEDQPRQEESTADTQEGREANYPNPIDFSPALEGIEAAIRDLIAEEDKVEASRKQDAESRDLNAQEAMAKWAFLMTIATIGGVIATFVGLVLIGKTLHHTRRAADYTRDMLKEADRSAAAAEGAVAATRDIGEKQVRAYLHVKDFSFCIGKKDGEIGATVSVANAGQSPAIGVKAVIAFQSHRQEPVILDVPFPNIAANSEKTRTQKPSTQKGSGIGIKGAERITAYVTITAKDVFGQDIDAVSMRTMHISGGAKVGGVYAPEDAEGYFPDEAVKLLANMHKPRNND